MSEFSKELCDERASNTKERLDKHSLTIDELKVCSIKLTEMLEIHNEKITDHENRLDNLENRPRDIVRGIVDGIISALVAAFICLIL